MSEFPGRYSKAGISRRTEEKDKVKFIKILGLAAIAAMALVGASSAMANGPTVLCKVHEEPCAAANIYTGHFEGLAKNPEVLSPIANIKCNHSVILGNALGLAAPQVTHLELVSISQEIV